MRRAPSFLAGALTIGLLLPSTALGGDPVPNAEEAAFATLLNEERTQRGLAPVAVSPALTEISDDYVAENDRLDDIDHSRDAPYTARARAVGCAKWDGPVLALGDQGARDVLDVWLGSDGHRAVLLDPEVTHLGAGFSGDAQLAYLQVCPPGSAADVGATVPGASPPPAPGPVPPAPGPAPAPAPPAPPAPAPGTPTIVAPPGSFTVGLATALRARGEGRSIVVPVRVARGTTIVRLVARRGRAVRRVTRRLPARTRAHRVRVRVPRGGRWTLDVRLVSGGRRGEATTTVRVRR